MVTTPEIETICPSCREPIDSLICPQCGRVAESPVHIPAETRALPSRVTAVPVWLPWVIAAGTLLVLALTAFIAISRGVPGNTVLVISVVVAALVFDYVNGMHDAGNAIATVISTRVLTPVAALVMAAVLNLVGALVHTGVAKSIATKFVDINHVSPLEITPMMILCGLIGASGWSYLTARWGLPVSTSHSLFGGLIGVFLVGGLPLNMGYVGQLAMWIVLAPLMAFCMGWALMLAIMWIFHRVAPHKINKHFRGWQIVSSAMMAFSHGSNDAQKAMGIITMALVSGGFITVQAGSDITVPLWVKIACAIVIALGTGLGGMRVIRTLGHKIIKLAPVHGFAAETVAAITIQLVTFLHIPISTTHVISSSILGIGASTRLSAVRWSIAATIVKAWFFTIPTCAAAGALLYWIVKTVFQVH